MKLVPDSASRRIALQMLRVEKSSPTLLFGVGVAGMIGSTVLACRATLKMEEAISNTRQELEVARTIEHREGGEHQRQKNVTVAYGRSVLTVGRLYAPAVLLGAASIGCLTKSHNILTERYLAVTAAYAVLEKGFDEYRARVVDKYGEEEDRKLRYATEDVQVIDSKGRMTPQLRVSPDAESIYARFFDPLSPNWSEEAEYNLAFLRAQQNYANDLLRSRGHIFLNEVYDMLGIERSRAGAVVGWVISEDGDNFIDFGLYEDNRAGRDFINGREGSILLDFNVDGTIWDKIPEAKRGRIAWQS